MSTRLVQLMLDNFPIEPRRQAHAPDGTPAPQRLVSPLLVKSTACNIAHHADDATGRAWPSIETLARYAGVSRAQMQRAVNALPMELISFEHRHGGKGRTSVYCVNIARLEELDLNRRNTEALRNSEALSNIEAASETNPSNIASIGPQVCSDNRLNSEARTVIEPHEQSRRTDPVKLVRLSPGWWKTDRGIDDTAKKLGFNIARLGVMSYPELKEKCFARLGEMRRLEVAA